MVGHGEEDNQNSGQHGGHHDVVNHLPFILVGKPGREPRAELSEYHEEEVDGGHARRLFLVELVPSRLVQGLVARSHVDRSLNTEGVLNQGEKIAHEQYLADETHHQTAKRQKEQAVGAGTDKTEQGQDGEAADAHQLFAAYAHQMVKERREGGHAYGGHEADERDVLRQESQTAHHLAAVGRVGAAHSHDGDEEQYQENDTEGLGHPVVEGEVIRESFLGHFSSALTIAIMPAASLALSSSERPMKSMRIGMRC